MTEEPQKNWWEAGATLEDDQGAAGNAENVGMTPDYGAQQMGYPPQQQPVQQPFNTWQPETQAYPPQDYPTQENYPEQEEQQMWVGPDGTGKKPSFSEMNGPEDARAYGTAAGSYGVTAGERNPGEYHRDEFPESLRPDMTMGIGGKPKKKKKRRRPEQEEDISRDLYEYGTEKPQKETRSKKQKKLERNEMKQKKKTEKEKKPNSSSTGMILLKVVACLVFVFFVGMQGMDRITTANALTGSATSFIKDHTGDKNNVTDLEFEGDKDLQETPSDIDDPSGGEETYNPKKFKYIDAAKLDEKSATDLAVWYLTQFPEGESKNEEAYKEFNKWYDNKKSTDSSFSANFDTALAYVKEHPELMNPNYKEPDVEEPENPENPENPDTPGTTPGTNPGPSGDTTGTSTTPPDSTTGGNGGTGTGSTVEEPVSKYPNIDETTLNSFSAAQVANWVFLNFPPDSASWNYQALSDYYNWIASKDATFRTSVNSYLEALGWNGNTN